MGRYYTNTGYVNIKVGKRWVHEHIHKAELVLGRRLKKGEVVHHIDMDKENNANSNLLICTSSYHHELHHRMGRAWVKEHILRAV